MTALDLDTVVWLGGAVVALGGLWWRTSTVRAAYERRLDAAATRDDLARFREEMREALDHKASKAEVIQHGHLLQAQAQALATIKAELEGLSRRIDDRLDATDARITELLDLVRQLLPRR
jgi:hypothetical protein